MKNYSRTKNSVYNLLTGFGGQLLNIILKFVCRTVFVQTLGVSYLGINGLFSDILTLLSLAELGFDMAISYRLYKPIAEGDDVKVREYLFFFKRVYIIIGVFIFIVGLAFIPLLKYLIADYETLEGLGINAAIIFLLYLFQNVSTYLFGAYRSIVLKAAQKQYVINVAGYIITILSSISQIGTLIFLHDFIAYIIVVTSFTIIQTVVNAILATKAFPHYFIKERSKLSRNEKYDLFKDCSALFVYKTNNIIMKVTDNLVLSSFIGLSIVGLYSNYLMVFMALNGVLNMIYTGIKASMGNLYASNDVKKKYFIFEVMSFVTSSIYGILAIIIALEINEFISVWIGEDFIIPQPFPILIGIEFLFTGLKLNLAQIRHVSGVFRQMWYRPVIGSVLNVVCSIILAQYMGISGVILGTLIAAIFANLAIDPQLIHKYSFNNYISVWHYYKKNICFILLITLICVLNYFLCTKLLPDHGIISLIIHSLLILFTSSLIISAMYWKHQEFIYIRGMIMKPLIKKR